LKPGSDYDQFFGTNRFFQTGITEEFLSEISPDMISESSLENLQELNKINARKGFLEASGYLYHFAPKSMRETLLEKGFTRESAKKAGASFVEDKILHFYTNPFSSIYSQDLFTSTYSEDFSVGGLKGEGRDIMDLYRVPVNKEILQGLSPDPNILSGSEIYTNDAMMLKGFFSVKEPTHIVQ